MARSSRVWLLRNALLVSVAIIGLMLVLGTMASLVRPLSWLGNISALLAAPPAFLVGRLLRPSGRSVVGFVAAEAGALIASIVFYALAAWIVLLCLSLRRSSSR